MCRKEGSNEIMMMKSSKVNKTVVRVVKVYIQNKQHEQAVRVGQAIS